MLNRQPVNSLKGIGEKTGKLFEKLGVVTIDDLLSYYPRAYDAYEPPVSIGQLKEQAVMAVESALVRGADLLRLGHMQIVSVQLKDLTGSLQVSWYNMPYMRANLKTGVTYVFRGRVVKKRGRMVMEQPEVFTPDSYQALAGSMQPVYGQTRGLSNKTIVLSLIHIYSGQRHGEGNRDSIQGCHETKRGNHPDRGQGHGG